MNIKLSSEKLDQLDLAETLSKGLELFQKKPIKLCLVIFVGFLVSVFSLGILMGVMFTNFFRITKKIDEDTEGLYEPQVSDLFQRMDKFVDCFILGLMIFGLIVLFHVMFYIIGLSDTFFARFVALSLATPIYILSFQIIANDDDSSALDALKETLEVIKNAPSKALGFGAILGVLASVPSILGTFLGFIVSTLTYAFSISAGRKFFNAVNETTIVEEIKPTEEVQ